MQEQSGFVAMPAYAEANIALIARSALIGSGESGHVQFRVAGPVPLANRVDFGWHRGDHSGAPKLLHRGIPVRVARRLVHAGETGAIDQLLHPAAMQNHAPDTFLAFWLCGWSLGGAFALTSLLWLIGGRERIAVHHDAFSIPPRSLRDRLELAL